MATATGDAYGAGDYSLKTLSKDGAVPACRMKDAVHVCSLVRRLWDNDTKRAWLRSRVAGLVGGNPPFRASKLRDANSAERTNVNWGTARSYLESGSGAFYDLFSEAPGLVGILQTHGLSDEDRDRYARIMSAKADELLLNHPLFDYHMQRSQWEMTLYGCGPLIFEDAFRVIPRSVHCSDLKVPERTKADAAYYEVATVDIDWYPPELYEFIIQEGAAQAGWRTEFSKRVIANAMDIRMPEGRSFDFEFYQQEIKNNSLSYYDDSKVCRCAYAFWKEFSGRITMAVVEREPSTDKPADYLFLHVGRYDNWRQCIHPMYFDRGHGGFHHSVVGLGVKMFGAMSHENRLICNLYDKAYAPDILFRPTTTDATNKFQVAHMSQYGLLPAGWEIQQSPVKGFVQDGLAMFQTTTELMKSNLSSYKQQVPMQKRGNPATKFEKQLEASQASALSKTTFNRYYRQLDLLYAEIVRRLCLLNSTDPIAEKFQEECMSQGVPRECFGRVRTVRAVRVVGEGSAFLRREAVMAISSIVPGLPEEGQQNWRNDFISANAGQQAVERYNPKSKKHMPDEQDERALNQVADMKVGVPPVINSSQNALRFAGIFLSSCVQAIQSVQQGGDIAQVIKFLDLAAPGALAHLKRIENDPMRKEAVDKLMEMWHQVAQQADKLKQMLMQQQQQKQAQQKKTSQVMTDEQIKEFKAKNDMRIKEMKTRGQLALQGVKTKQDLALADMQAASKINGSRLASVQE